MANKKRTKETVCRARQFIPFDALKGFQEELRKREVIKVKKITLSEEESDLLSHEISKFKRGQLVSVTYFDNDDYKEKTGMIRQVDPVYKTVTIVKDLISYDDILKVKFLD